MAKRVFEDNLQSRLLSQGYVVMQLGIDYAGIVYMHFLDCVCLTHHISMDFYDYLRLLQLDEGFLALGNRRSYFGVMIR